MSCPSWDQPGPQPTSRQLASCQRTACSTQTYGGPKPQRPIFQTTGYVRCKGVYGPRAIAGSFPKSCPYIGSLQDKQEAADVTEAALPRLLKPQGEICVTENLSGCGKTPAPTTLLGHRDHIVTAWCHPQGTGTLLVRTKGSQFVTKAT